ncbi:MAG: bifunctional adenosylcobinamide kinase/adenosylcobinamide-phosphate guanylyltransferase [Pseudomonadales bacterium]|nr:bifunctional adenosylcobinamide kinase/adenosylcobinamide-phosphate guanylyltransferase [Pseudomonadales bacterium]
MLSLILGGARSGKSAFAERLATASGKQRIYIATATAGDQEMRDRISHHQQQRDDDWILVEEPLKLVTALQQHAAADKCILVDCLTLWLTNLLLNENPALLEQETGKLLAQLESLEGDIIFVSNEVGMGLVAADPVSRRFVDESGRLHQAIAARCDEVYFVVAGIAQKLKPVHG